ncbi:hypothetical protein AWB82_04780 [Caballeronia glebae]|jgi:hypothetical protein|uniref:Uncharacterized protein n=1 Tax=Caballeronia glebae TaxID=1777143 RepID=A0A158C0H8_9BURK|nr:hypothetical protein [Caballeronia glebae]SAK75396.1 hypothetical protein AWB82_04780 [Caballeronia glebae]
MKQSNTAPESVPERGRELASKDHEKQARDDASNAPLPHEADQNVESQHEHDARDVGKQAHEDIERGLVDTDRRGGGDYQRDTQRDEHANVNSDEGGARKP